MLRSEILFFLEETVFRADLTFGFSCLLCIKVGKPSLTQKKLCSRSISCYSLPVLGVSSLTPDSVPRAPFSAPFLCTQHSSVHLTWAVSSGIFQRKDRHEKPVNPKLTMEPLNSRTKGLGCHLVYPFIFGMRKLWMRDVKELIWKCIVWPLLVWNCLVVTIVTTLMEDNLPQCLMRVCEHCLYLPGRVPYFRRHYVILQGFLLHYGQWGGILWKSTCESLSQMVKCCLINLQAFKI